MYLFFVDESVTPPSPERAIDSPYLVLGGLIIHSDDWLDLDSDFKMIKKKLNVTGEIKWRYFQMSPHKKGHSLENLSQDVKEQLRTEIYSLIQKYKRSKTLCVVFNTQNFYTLFEDHNNPKNNADNVYNNAYGIVFGAYNHFLKQRSSKGIMICDNRNPNQDEILRKYHDYKSNLYSGH